MGFFRAGEAGSMRFGTVWKRGLPLPPLEWVIALKNGQRRSISLCTVATTGPVHPLATPAGLLPHEIHYDRHE
jgi:hypothetical protein